MIESKFDYTAPEPIVHCDTGRLCDLKLKWLRYREAAYADKRALTLIDIVSWIQTKLTPSEVFTVEEILNQEPDELVARDVHDKIERVAFRRFPVEDDGESGSGGEVIALFPDQVESKGLITSYMHVGQHSAASVDLLTELVPADLEEVAELSEELYKQGYRNLQIIA